MNVYDYAMKMELDGKAFYEKMASECGSEGLKKIFNELAADEQKHYEIFRRLKAKEDVDSMIASTALDDAKNLFADMQVWIKSQAPLTTTLNAYRHAMKTEKESAALYLEAAEKETDERVKALLVKIADEEQKHYNILENVYEFVNAPSRTLVWAESTRPEIL